ncbi:hypothetical protein I4U23_027727 [Adineta vaga]|nr:hypothetical protein I4U23_027727 [Adineta vaga]
MVMLLFWNAAVGLDLQKDFVTTEFINTITIQNSSNIKMTIEPIAMVGISCTFAGGIDSPESFWKVLKNSIDVGSTIPEERFNVDSFAPYYNSKKSLIRNGYFLNNDQLHNFDPAFFGITDGEAMSMDPCHRILLEKFVHLLEDANYPVDQIKGSRTAVYIGQFTTDHSTTFQRSKVEEQSNLLGPNLGLYNASARISYHFDLHGPNLTMDTACSSSLQATHLAIQSLRNGEVDFAVAGASNLNYTPESFFVSLITGAVSPDGRSRAYSDDANGYAKAEGVGLILLKRLSDAIRDQDKIYCVIRHGTGTQVGDPIEANTIGHFFNRSPYNSPLLIGSVKSVIGHTEGTAGIASLIKIALCMKYRMITPNMNFTRLNPKIHAEKYNLHIVNHLVNFPEQLITVGINNFGIGGNTAHAIVTECGQGPQWWAMGRELYSNEPVFRHWIEKLDAEFLSVSNNSFSILKELIEPKKEEDSQIHFTNIAQPSILAIQIALTSLWLSWGIYPTTIIGHSVGEIAAAYVAGRLTLREAVEIIYHRSRVQNYNTNKGGRMLALFLSEADANDIIFDVKEQVQIAAINSPKSVTLGGDENALKTIYDHLSATQPTVFKTWLKIQNAFHTKQMERFNIREELLQSLSHIKGDGKPNEFDERCSNAILYSTVTGTRADHLNFDGEYWWKNVRNAVLFNQGIQTILNDSKDSNMTPIFLEISPHPVLSAAIPECARELNQTPLVVPSLKRKQNEQQTMLLSLCSLNSHLNHWKTFLNSSINYQLLLTLKTNSIFKTIDSFLDTLPNYSFNHQIYWYETKDSVFSRRAIKKQHHPLLGYRLWHNERQTPTWKNLLTLNNNSNDLSYLNDHQVHGEILFPAAAFIELIISALNQLLQNISSDQQSITLQNIQFLHGLYLNPDETIHLETVIIMPFKEFYIYSRRKSPNDSIRLSGISGNDIITAFNDEDILHKYSSKEWTLNCRGSINLKFDTLLINSKYDYESILTRLLPSKNNKSQILINNENDVASFYKYSSANGISYGPQFQSLKNLYRYEYEALSEMRIPSKLFQEENFKKDQYICHPALLDGCFHGIFSFLPGYFSDTFVPISIDEIILFNRKTSFVSILEQINTKFYVAQSLHKSIKGITSDTTFTTDILLFSQNSSLLSSIMTFRGFKLQNFPNKSHSKSIIGKIGESSSIFNNNPKKIVPVNDLIEHFCAYQSWKLTDLPSNEISQSKTIEEFWIIFSDQKFHLGKQIADLLLKHEVKNENITLIYLTPMKISIDNNSFEQILINDISTIQNIIQLKSLSKNSVLNILFNWSIDLPDFNSTNDLVFQSQEQIGCGTLMHILQTIYQLQFDNYPNIFVLTENSQPMNNKKYSQENFNLIQSPIIGFARSIINEYKTNRMKLIDLQFSHLSTDFLEILIEEFNLITNSSPNEEILLRYYNNKIEKFIPEYSFIESSKYDNWNSLEQKEILPKEDIDQHRFQLEIPKSRHISDLQWIHQTNNSKTLLPTEIEIRIHCVSMNFRDMLKVQGLHPYIRGKEDQYDRDEIMGADFSGIIIRKGSQVKLNLNERIFGSITNESVFKSHVILNENDVHQAPVNLTMEELTTLPTYLPVLYCLENRIQLKKEQTILIHTATSGVGLAFIQYAQMIGANIIATAGTEEKREFLKEKYQLKHVFNSRDLSFIPKIREIAPNGIVDIIINSLLGTFRNESLELLAPFGHFIELNKRDVYSNSQLSLFSLRTNSTCHIIDMISLQKSSPSTIQNLLTQISNYCSTNQLKPIRPIKEFQASQIQQAFSTYSQGTHCGKFVIKIAESNDKLTIETNRTEKYIQNKRKENLFPDEVCCHGTIVISGGLGGIGIDISKWMIKERGVKRIVLLSRRNLNQLDQKSSQYQNWIQLKEIAEENNAWIEIMQADVTDLQQILSVFHTINENKLYPIRGIIHSAMVLHDSLLKNMTNDLLSEVMKPKIRGAWNLHQATVTLTCPIHFFIMFSSIRNHIPDIGQSNYNAGNNFLDNLAYWRLNYLNLPAISIGLPAISGAGYLHQNAQSTIQLMEDQGMSINDLALFIQNKFIDKQIPTNNTQHLSNNQINYINENTLLNNETKQFEMNSSGTSLVNLFHKSDSKYSLFCIHDIIGLSQTFIQLTIRLKDIYGIQCPSIYAFRASGYESNERFFQSIETIAEQYIFQMKRIQPTGPYYLLGYSFGGIVAYEMARQLFTKHQTTVQSLVLIDPPIPIQNQNILSKEFGLIKTIGMIFSYLNKETNPDEFIQELLNLSIEERNEKLDYLTKQILFLLKTRYSKLKNDNFEQKIFEVIKNQIIAKESYTYDLAKESNESIQIKKSILFTLKENNQFTSNETKHQIWNSLLSQLNIENIDGTHDTLLENPSVHFIVDRLKQMNFI